MNKRPEVDGLLTADYGDAALEVLFDRFFNAHADRIGLAKKILVKPNLLQAAPPEKAVTTHPAFLKTVIERLKAATDADIVVGDSPGANFNAYDTVLDVTGIGRVCEEAGVKTVRVESFEPVRRGGTVYSSLIDEVDLIVNVAKLKTHALTGLTMAVKNVFGLVPGNAKVGYHRRHPENVELGRAIFEFFDAHKGKMLHILDGILAHEGEGPSRGTPVTAGIVAVSDDAVALDIAVTRMLGLPDDFGATTKAAIDAGYDPSNIVVTDGLYDVDVRLALPMSMKAALLPNWLKGWAARHIHARPVVNNEKCIRCMLCVRACPVDAISAAQEYEFPVVDHDTCIECYCCYEVCESDALDLKRSLLHRMVVS